MREDGPVAFSVGDLLVGVARGLRAALQRMLDSKEAYVLDVIVPYTEHVLPMIPAGKTVREIIIEKDSKPILGTNLGL